MGFFRSIILRLKKRKTIKSQRAGDLLTYHEFCLKNISDLKVTGPICNKDLKRLIDIIKKYKKLTTLDLSETTELLEIPNNLFHRCDCLKTVILPKGIIRIGESAFEYCRALEQIILPDELQTISKSAFYGCEGLKKIYITKNVKSIGGWALSANNLEHITVDPNNAMFKAIDNILYTSDGKTLIKYPTHKKEASFTIPDGVSTIINGAFIDCDNLLLLKFPTTLKKIEDNAFLHSTITTAILPEGTEFIGKLAFAHCAKLTTISIPGTVKHIGERAFTECNSLCSVEIKDGVTGIEDNIFYNCHCLTHVDLPESALYVPKEF